jgi:hypothetical protein
MTVRPTALTCVIRPLLVVPTEPEAPARRQAIPATRIDTARRRDAAGEGTSSGIRAAGTETGRHD